MRHTSGRILAVVLLFAAASLSAGTVTVSNLNATGAGSLADAVDQANNGTCADPCTIAFSVSGTIAFGGRTISASDVTVDGSTAPGASKNHGGFPGPFNAVIPVTLTGSGTSAHAFTIGGRNVTISSLRIQNYTADAILIDGNAGIAQDDTVEGCIITNNGRGVTVQNGAKGTLIGTGRPATNPLLAGNGTGNPGDRNLIAASTDWDVAIINSTNNAASGNFLGVSTDGVTPLPSATGVFISGGSTNGAGGGSGNNSNVIGGHTADAIRVTGGAANTLINGNYIGIGISGGAVPNAVGIRVDGGASATIGGIQRNVISGNGTGIFAGNPTASGRVVVQGGNLIGTDPTGTTAVANSGYGIRTAGNTAGNLYVTGNTVAFNGAGGILPGGTGAEIRGANLIFGNTGQGIDLAGNGSFVANDAGDADTGNDNLQNYPAITLARIVSGTLMFNATVDSSSVAATTSMAIDVWKADASGGARTYIGTSGCIAGRNLQDAAMQMPAGSLADGDKIVATATSYTNASCTSLSDGTSEISPAVAVCVAPPAAITIDNGAAFACAGTSGHTASVVNTAGATYAWSITNGTITAGQGTSAITFTAGSAGTTTVNVTASLGACPNPASASITVRALPSPFINGPSTACASVPFTLDAGPGWASYLWSTGETTRTISVSQTQQTTYSVTVSDGSCSGTTSKTVPMAFPADATITAPASVCAASSGVTASVPLNANATFVWTISGGTITSSTTGNAITFDVPLNSSGVTLGVTATANGCTTTGAKSVAVNALPAAAISAPANVCANATGVTASTPAIAGATYVWTIGGGSITNGAGTDTITFAVAPNATTVTLGVTVTNANGCKSSHSAPVPVSPATIPLTAPANACAGATGVTASVASVAGAAYNWSVTGGTITSGQGTSAVTFDVNASVSSVTVNATRTLSGCTATASQSIPIGAPDATITAPSTVCAGGTAQASVPASGGATYSWSLAGGTITAGAGTNSITFAPSQSGSVSLSVTVSGNQCSASSSKNITVSPVPQVSISAPQSLTQNTSGTATASSSLTSTFVWTITGGAINSGQGTPSITFTAGSAAQTVISVTATAGGCSGNAAATVTTVLPITITTTSLPIGAVNDAYHATVAATGGSGPITFSVVSGLLPSGLTLASDGTISGTPVHAGTAIVDIQATDGTRTTAGSFSIGIVNGLTVSTTSLPNGSIAIPYSAALAAAGGATPFTWTLAGGSLPPGLSLGNAGSIAGTPFADGTYRFTVQVTDGHGSTARATLSITIGAALHIVTAVLPNTPLGSGVTFPLQAAGGTTPYRWSLIAGSLPAGLSLSTDGVISGKATARETATFTVRVTDAVNSTDERQFVLSTDCADIALLAPKPEAVREVTTDVAYVVDWAAVPAATSFELQESLSTSFGDTATVIGVDTRNAEFKHPADSPTAYYYRARSISDCSGAKSAWSEPIRVVVVPIGDPHSREFHVTAPLGTDGQIFIPIFIGGSDSPRNLATTFASTPVPPSPPPPNAPFTATSTSPFVSVTPSSGTIPSNGVTITAAVAPTGLPPGTSTAVVTVTSTATNTTVASIPVSVSLTTPVLLSPSSPAAATSLIIPAVAHVDGQSASFASDLRVANVTSQASKYEVTFTPWGTQQQTQATTFTVNSAQTILLDDVVRHLFGFGSLQDGSAGTLAVRRLDGSSDAHATVAWAHMYSGASANRVGQFIPSVGLDKFAALAQTLSLQHLAQSSTTRTNLGLIEGGGAPVTLLAKAFDPHGNLLTQFGVNLNANEHTQLNSVLLQNGVSSPDARVELTVASGDGRVSAYASVIDNGTSDASLVPATDATRVSSTRYVIPGVTHVDAGGASWRSDVRIFNPTENALSLDVSFVPQNTSSPQTKSLSVAPHEVAILDDVVAQTFGVSDAGAFHVSSPNATPLVVTARTYRATEAGALGQFIAATTPQDATGTGERSLHIVGVEESQQMRTNVGVYETAGAPATVDLSVTTADGRASTHVSFGLQPYEFRQLSSVLRSIGYTDTYNATVDITVKSGQGRVSGYASVIENASGDPLYVPAQ